MKKIYILFAALTLALPLMAQDEISRALAAVEANNTTLKALREGVEAQKLENRTGIYLENPEVGFNYLWGAPNVIGNRTDVSVVQKLDFPTLSGLKSRVADGQNELAELRYLADRMAILLEAKQYCIDLIYSNKMYNEMQLRCANARTIAASYAKMLESGEVSRIEYNKAQLNLSTAEGELQRAGIERDAVRAELRRLNGGQDIRLEGDSYGDDTLPQAFEDWYAIAETRNPLLAYVRQEIEVSRQRISLNKAQGLPVLSGGYMSEKVVGEHFRGITLGVSIPLWANRNNVRRAQAAARAAEMRHEDAKQQFYNRLQILYARAAGLETTSAKYRVALAELDNTAMLKQALDAGEMSLLEYLLETAMRYDAIDKALAAERDYRRAVAELEMYSD
ncbi:MAG: TolC family protein [Tannerella sp.]|jgi:outer membrane protein TolC|nr:TolC family protein [Tannerella sp.]